MSKRFTDTNKWSQSWFRKLSPKMKCAWIYLCDKCDHAGVWEVDTEAMSFFIGDDIFIEELTTTFDIKLKPIDANKFIIQAFIDFQYGSLNPENRVHLSVISRLQKLAPNKDLISPLQGAKDKDKDKDKDLDKEKDKEKDKGSFYKKIEKVYLDHYPLKKGKTPGVTKLSKEIKSDEDIEKLVRSIETYKKSINDVKFIKHFSTFANEWRDWLDDNAGKSISPVASKASKVFDIAREQIRRIEAGEL